MIARCIREKKRKKKRRERKTSMLADIGIFLSRYWVAIIVERALAHGLVADNDYLTSAHARLSDLAGDKL